MTETEAYAFVADRWDGVTVAKIELYAGMLIAENDHQNLIAPSTVATLWSRHLVDSAQLIDLAPDHWQHWVDIGAGAGLPGLVIAILSGRAVTLIEPRRLRVGFLERCRSALGLPLLTILPMKAENAEIAVAADVVSARAVAKLDRLFSAAQQFASATTTYILPKGEGAKSEVAIARRSWQGTFHVKHSIVDPKSGIVVATGVAPR